MRYLLPLLCFACTPPTTRVAGVNLRLVTPSAVNATEGSSRLVVRVFDEAGGVVTQAEGDPSLGVPVPPITWFGPQEIEVTAQSSSGEVLAAARTGLIDIQPGDEREIATFFLPINQAIPLDWTPNSNRVGHIAALADDGRVLLIGGRQPSAAVVRTDSEWWDIEAGFDGEGPRLNNGASRARWTALDDGALIIAGGDTQGGSSDAVFAVSAAKDEIRDLDVLATAVNAPCVASHPSTGALILGEGLGYSYSALGRTGTLSGLDTNGITECVASEDFLLTVGEADRWGVFDLRDAQSINDLAGAVTWLDAVPRLDGAHLVALPDGRFWVGGGFGFAASASTRIITPRGAEVQRTEDLEQLRVFGHAELWRGEYVMLAGGYSDDIQFDPVQNLSIHHPDDGPTLSIDVPMRTPTAAVLTGGAVLLTGGLNLSGEPAGAYAVMPWVSE
ncbi:MAG: hypothetical protein AB8H79_11415 [Myxococcota bacterium]